MFERWGRVEQDQQTGLFALSFPIVKTRCLGGPKGMDGRRRYAAACR
jgi:hypothetical protein